MDKDITVVTHCQQVAALGLNSHPRNLTIVDTPAAPSPGRLCQSLEHGRGIEIAAIVIRIKIGSIGKHIAQLCITTAVDGIRLRAKGSSQRDVVQRIGHQLGMLCLKPTLLRHLIRRLRLPRRNLCRCLSLNGYPALRLRLQRSRLCPLLLTDGFLTPFL